MDHEELINIDWQTRAEAAEDALSSCVEAHRFEVIRANLAKARADRAEAELAQLRELYEDRVRDLKFEYGVRLKFEAELDDVHDYLDAVLEGTGDKGRIAPALDRMMLLVSVLAKGNGS